MPYANVQFIAYEVYTGKSATNTYAGLADPYDDVKGRVKLMHDAIEEAYKRVESKRTEPDDSCLKIFVAPEFYFRGPTHAYDLEVVVGGNSQHHGLLEQLSAITREGRFKNWLFVFGSTLVRWQEPFLDQTMVYNYCIVQKGGFMAIDNAPSFTWILQKEYKSGIDFLDIDSTGVPGSAIVYPDEGVKGGYDLEVNQHGGGGGYNGGSLITVDGILFGIELCLDHAKSRLRDAPPGPGQLYPQIQIIPSAGMTIKPACVAVAQGGLVFNVDGYSNGSIGAKPTSYGYHCELARATTTKPNSALDLTVLPPVGHPLFTNREDTATFELFNVPPGENPDEPDHPPCLVIYAPEPVPASTAVPMPPSDVPEQSPAPAPVPSL